MKHVFPFLHLSPKIRLSLTLYSEHRGPGRYASLQDAFSDPTRECGCHYGTVCRYRLPWTNPCQTTVKCLLGIKWYSEIISGSVQFWEGYSDNQQLWEVPKSLKESSGCCCKCGTWRGLLRSLNGRRWSFWGQVTKRRPMNQRQDYRVATDSQ